jgi:hypothetical protein
MQLPAEREWELVVRVELRWLVAFRVFAVAPL